MNIDSALVRELAELLAETGLSEIEVEDGERKIRVSRQMIQQMAAAIPAAAPAAAPAIPASAKTEAQRHFTRPARAWPARLVRALMLTATAAVPMAAWVDWTPTT